MLFLFIWFALDGAKPYDLHYFVDFKASFKGIKYYYVSLNKSILCSMEMILLFKENKT